MDALDKVWEDDKDIGWGLVSDFGAILRLDT